MPSPKMRVSTKHKLHREYKANMKRAEQSWGNHNLKKINGRDYRKINTYPTKVEAEKEVEIQKAEGAFTSVERTSEGWILYVFNPKEEKSIIGVLKSIAGHSILKD